jgi:tetratricopeptide (TPR) repeat protein
MGIRFLLIPEPAQDSFELLLRAAGIRPAPLESPALPVVEIKPPPHEEEVQLVIEEARRLIAGGEAREAIPFLQLAVRNHPDCGPLRAILHLAAGLTARDMGLVAPARNHFARALRFDPDSTLILRHLRDDDT